MTIYTTLDLDESDFKKKNELRGVRASDSKGNLIPTGLLETSAHKAFQKEIIHALLISSRGRISHQFILWSEHTLYTKTR